MTKRWESTFTAFDGLKLFAQGWNQSESCGTILITHGQGEHSEAYHRLINFFSNSPLLSGPRWDFISWDLRGHGRSEGKRGYVNDFTDYVKDYVRFLEYAFTTHQLKKPVILFSHSMGGLIQLSALTGYGVSTDGEQLVKKHPAIVAQVCSAPLLQVAVAVPTVKEIGAHFLSSVFPKLTLWNELNYQMLTRDPDVIREFEVDPLRHDQISSRVYLGMKEAFTALPEKAHQIVMPSLLQIAENDPIVSTAAAKDFFERMTSNQKRILVYGEGSKHELYNDINREKVCLDLHQFLQPWTQEGH